MGEHIPKQKKVTDILGPSRTTEVSEGVFPWVGEYGTVKSILVSRGKWSDFFFTEDSGLYITPGEQRLLEQGAIFNRTGRWDSLGKRVLNDYQLYRPQNNDMLTRALYKRFQKLKELAENPSRFFGQPTLVQMWNFSMVGAIIIGMVSMTFIYRYLGQGALADTKSAVPVQLSEMKPNSSVAKNEAQLNAEALKNDDIYEYFNQTIKDMEEAKQDEFEEKIREMVKGHPIEEMVPYIAKKDKVVAAFLISIAKKESNWGKRVPVLNGQDCYNYWGYRGIRKLMGTGGHTCFNSRQDAVDTVAKRLEFLVSNKKLNTPEKMVIWKCGSDCEATGGIAAARKWISDVDLYFSQLNS